jgi:hypothetical protein
MWKSMKSLLTNGVCCSAHRRPSRAANSIQEQQKGSITPEIPLVLKWSFPKIRGAPNPVIRPWLSIESHGDLGIPHLKKPPYMRNSFAAKKIWLSWFVLTAHYRELTDMWTKCHVPSDPFRIKIGSYRCSSPRPWGKFLGFNNCCFIPIKFIGYRCLSPDQGWLYPPWSPCFLMYTVKSPSLRRFFRGFNPSQRHVPKTAMNPNVWSVFP